MKASTTTAPMPLRNTALHKMKKLVICTENAEYQIIKALKTNREKRNKSQEIFIEGIECVKQAVNANIGITRIITPRIDKLSGWGKELIAKNENAGIIEMTEPLFSGLCDKSNPSELLITAKMRRYELNDISNEKPFIIVFDRPSDYGNLGSLIRSANAFCADGVFLTGHGIDVYESKVIRASLGSVFFTKVVLIESMNILKEYIESQKTKNNMLVVGTDSAGECSLSSVKIVRPVMVIIGNEAKGMSVRLKELCDKIIRIPMGGNVNSLNVSCAASVVMWQVFNNV